MTIIADGDEMPGLARSGSNARTAKAHNQWLAWRQGAQDRMAPVELLNFLALKAEERRCGIRAGR